MKTAKAKLILIALLLLFAPAIYAITGNNSDNYTHVGTITSIVANTTTEDYTGRISAGQHPASTFNNSNSTTGRFGILDAEILTAPQLYSPTNNQTIFDLTPTFIWNNSFDPNHNTLTYQLQVDDTEDFSSALEVNLTYIEEITTQTSRRITNELETDKVYYWRVRANDGLNDGPYSEIFSFNLDSNTAITLLTNVIEFGLLPPGRTNQTFPTDTSTVIHKQNLILDGNEDYIDSGSNTSLKFGISDSFTISAWIKPNLAGNDMAIVGNSFETKGYNLRINTDNELTFTVLESDSIFKSSNSAILTNNVWTHVIGTWNTTHVDTYINAVINSTDSSAGSLTDITSTSNLYIGSLPDTATYFNGSIDELLIFNRTLTSSEIENLYIHGANNSLHNTSNNKLSAHWSFEGNATDSSGNNNNGILNGDSQFSQPFVDPFILENQGNVFINVSIRSTSLFSSIGLDEENYQYRPDDRFEILSYFISQSISEYTNMKASDELAVRLLSFRNETDSAVFDIKVISPDDEPAGVKTSTVTFTAEKS